MRPRPPSPPGTVGDRLHGEPPGTVRGDRRQRQVSMFRA